MRNLLIYDFMLRKNAILTHTHTHTHTHITHTPTHSVRQREFSFRVYQAVTIVYYAVTP